MSLLKKILLLQLLFAGMQLSSQPVSFPVLRSIRVYKKSIREKPDNEMTELRTLAPGLVYDLRYATTNNFMHRLMYPSHTRSTFMRKPAAVALAAVEATLKQEGLGLKIFDAYRPFAVTKKFWELVPDERYAANPAKGSNHNRGTAVDLTLIDLKTGKELPMGTGFDNFTDSAHHSFTNLPQQVLQNRVRLRSVMEQNGFKPLSSEWWHYTYGNGSFDVLDLSFDQLNKMGK
ncbi:M15 family metallopeptidase [Niabella beijingensis]|uniref:M15 family metallopeptidase n=1 Tax=Niabella beijingensis TaxID=2872700 RepID=UPI001CBE34E6|nr:M15 family metallopeptidase [Niabella beijingensis]